MTETVLCPDCGSGLDAVQAKARSGYLLALDQCGRCGGVWFDRWELFPLHHDEVGRLDPLDGDRLLASVCDAQLGRCPRCEIDLRAFRDPNIPSDARIARCAVCEGMWLQRGQLTRVKAAAVNKAGAPKPIDDPELRRLVSAYGDAAGWQAIHDLDGATHEVEPPPPSLADAGEGIAQGLPWLVLGSLLRLLLRR